MPTEYLTQGMRVHVMQTTLMMEELVVCLVIINVIVAHCQLPTVQHVQALTEI